MFCIPPLMLRRVFGKRLASGWYANIYETWKQMPNTPDNFLCDLVLFLPLDSQTPFSPFHPPRFASAPSQFQFHALSYKHHHNFSEILLSSCFQNVLNSSRIQFFLQDSDRILNMDLALQINHTV